MNGNIGFKAKWQLILRDKQGNIKEKREGFNEMSKAAKVRAGCLGSQYLMDLTNNLLGRWYIAGADGWLNFDNARSVNNVFERRVAVLNMQGRTKTEHFLPVYNSDGIEDCTVGYFNASPDGKAYYFVGNNLNTIKKQEITGGMIGNETVGFFDNTKANGTIDTVAVMSGFTKGSARGNGFSLWQSISKNYAMSSNNSYSWMLPPNIQGLTNEYEILVCCPNANSKVYKINFQTGTITDTEYDQTLWGMPSASYNSIRLSTFIRINNSMVAYDFSNGSQKIVLYAADGTPTVVASSSLSASTYYTGWYMLPNDNDYVYFNTYNSTGTRSFYKYMITSPYTRSTATDPMSNLPALYNESTYYYKPIIACCNEDRTQYWISSKYRYETFLCTDLSNVKSTIIGRFRSIHELSSFKMLNKDWLYKCGFRDKSLNVEDNGYAAVIKTNPESGSTETGFPINSICTYCGFICPDLWSNWYNCWTLDEPITKTSDDTLEVSCWVYPDLT